MFAAKQWYESSEKASTLLCDAIAFCKGNRAVRENRWRRYAAVYNNQHDLTRFSPSRGEYPYESDLKFPTCYVHVEGPTTQVALALLSNNPMARANAKHEEAVEGARKAGWLINHQLEEDVDIRAHLTGWIRESMRISEYPLKVGWTVTSRRVRPRRFDPHTGQWVKESAAERTELHGHPTVEGIERQQVFVDPWGTDEQKARFIIHRMVWTPDQLEQYVDKTDKKWEKKAVKSVLAKARQGKAKESSGGNTDAPDLTGEERNIQAAEEERRTGYNPSEHDSRLITLWDYWEDEVHIMAAGDESKPVVLLREPNPFEHGMKPFVFLRMIKLENEFDGKCVQDAAGDLFHEKDRIRNQRMENVKRNVNGLMAYNEYVVNGDMLASRPWGQVPVQGQVSNQFEFFQPGDVTSNAYDESRIVEEEIQLATGFTNTLQGAIQRGADETARGLSMRQQTANSRFELIAAGYAADLRKVLKMIHAMNRQYLADSLDQSEGLVRIVGEDGQNQFLAYTYEDINRDYDFEFTMDPTAANRGATIQQMVNYLSAVAGIPGFAETLDPIEHHKVAYEAMGFRSDAKRFIRGLTREGQREDENFLTSGVYPPAVPHQDHVEHMEGHTITMQKIGQLPPDLQAQALEFSQDHMRQHGYYRQQQYGEAEQELSPA